MERIPKTLYESVILNKSITDTFLKESHPADLIALYVFYYYTAKYQQTNSAWATNGFVAKGLHWSVRKVMKVRKDLIRLGFITTIKRRDPKTKQFTKWYVAVKYMWRRNTLQTQYDDFQHTGPDHSVDEYHTNASNAVSRNAYSSNKKIHKQQGIGKSKEKLGLSKLNLEEFYDIFNFDKKNKERGP
jgi:hypothetical protein